MPIYAKPGPTWRAEAIPWHKHPTRGVWEKPVKVYRKVPATGTDVTSDYWVEVWPLLAGSVSGATLAQVYRNDRMEWDLSWAAPVDGTPTSYYIVQVVINGQVYATYNVTGGFTLTNNGNGFQTYAGQPVYFTVTPYTAAGRPGPVAQSATTTVSQLPPPPAPTGFAITLTDGVLGVSWSQAAGRRVTGVILQTNAPGAPGGVANIKTYGAGSVAVSDVQCWDRTAPTGGFNFTVTVQAYGPGGSSSALQLTGAVPADPLIWSCRFTSGVLQYRVTVNPANTTALDQYWRNANSSTWNVIGTTPVSFSNIDNSVPGSGGFARDLSYYQVAVKGRSVVGGGVGTGKPIYSRLIRKLPLPYIVSPIDSNTWYNGGWRNDQTFVIQGYYNGMNYGFVWYGNKLRDELGDATIGYTLNISAAEISIGRGSVGIAPSPPNQASLRLWLHRGATIADGFLSLADGGQVLPAMVFEQQAWGSFPPHWARYLIDQYSGFKGVGFYDADTFSPDGSGVSRTFFGTHKSQFIINGVPALSLRIWHDG